MPEPASTGSGGTTVHSTRAPALIPTSHDDDCLNDCRFGVAFCIPERCEPSGTRVARHFGDGDHDGLLSLALWCWFNPREAAVPSRPARLHRRTIDPCPP